MNKEEIINYIEKNEYWLNAKKLCHEILEKKEYHCNIDSNLHMNISDTIIIRYTINDKFPAKLNMVNSIDKIKPIIKESFTNYEIMTPFHVKIASMTSEDMASINEKIVITEVLSEMTIDFLDYNKFCGFNNCTNGKCSFPINQEQSVTLEKIKDFLKKMNVCLEQIVVVL